MQWTTFNILILVSALLAVVGMIKPTWPLIAIAVFLIAVALLVGK